MRFPVTGGEGFVGSHAARLLAESGHEVWVVDNRAEDPRAAAGKLPLVVTDLLDRATISARLEENRVKAVMYFAAYAYVGGCSTKPCIRAAGSDCYPTLALAR